MKPIWFVVVLSSILLSVPTAFSQPVISPQPEVTTQKTIHLNQASVSELTNSFKGIGRKRAEAIVAYRESHGPFKAVADLAQVRGLGHTFINNHLEQLQKAFEVN